MLKRPLLFPLWTGCYLLAVLLAALPIRAIEPACFTLAPTATPTATPTVTLTRTAVFTATRTNTPMVGVPHIAGFIPAVVASRDVALDPVTHRAYISSLEFGLSVVDVTNPSAPVVLGAANPPFVGDLVAFSGLLAVVTGANSGTALWVVDISNPASPHYVGSLAGGFNNVAMAGQFAYAVGGFHISTVSVATPTNPAIVSTTNYANSGNTSSNLTLAGSFLYLIVTTPGGAQLQIYSISNPAAPAFVGAVGVAGSGGVAVSGSFAYVTSSSLLQVVNVSVPSAPTIVGSLSMPGGAVSVSGNRLYTLDGANLRIVDITVPSSPTPISLSDGHLGQRIDVTGTTVYITSPSIDPATATAGLYLVNASTPTSPTLFANVYNAFDNSSVSVAGTLGLVTANAFGMRVIDVTSPATPHTLSAPTGTWSTATIVGHLAYGVKATNTANPNLVILDLTNPASPVTLSQTSLAPAERDIKVSGSFAYLANSSGLLVMNVANPSAPSTVTTLGGFSASQVVIVGNTAYVQSFTGTQIINITNPASPSVINTLAVKGPLAVVNNLLYVTDGGTNFTITDVSNPNAPVLLSTSNAFLSQAVTVNGTRAYLVTPGTHQGGGVFVYDVANPSAPVFVTQVVVPGTSRTATTANSLIYTGDSASTIDIIQP